MLMSTGDMEEIPKRKEIDYVRNFRILRKRAGRSDFA